MMLQWPGRTVNAVSAEPLPLPFSYSLSGLCGAVGELQVHSPALDSLSGVLSLIAVVLMAS